MVPKAIVDANSLPHFAGYTLLEQLYAGPRTIVYRAISTANQQPVIIKLLIQPYPSFHDLLKFRNQYTITRNLNIPGIVKSLSLESYNNSYALIMEDVGGLSLQQYIQHQPLSLSEILTIALQLTDILQDLHQHRIIHKDIKPANLLIHPQSQQINLIDFSIASLLPKETQDLQDPQELEGTLAYLAPEQTGRMNRGIDYRADFYAFGVTLYELLTGELPFPSEDPLEVVHCHIAKAPIPVYQLNPEVPGMVSAIVAKLMAKNAEDRYQSALGLKHDLTTCLTQLQQTGTIASFELRMRDVCDRFLIPEKLYGRESEVQTLLEAFDRVSQGQTELLLVAGFSGIGKTAVINEVHKPITRQHGYFIKGKFDQFSRNIPFSAFVQAFRSLMGQLLGESDAALATWKAQILEAVGESGQVLINVIPELERIIGSQPPVPDLSGNAAQNRFNLLFGNFVRIFATPQHPLVIFLDDLQWVDSASLNLLKLILGNDTEASHLLVLGAYRDNEVFPAHPLILALEDLRQQNTKINTLTLSPLTDEAITHLVANTLRCPEEVATPLSMLIYQKAQGNPFFTTQFLLGLHAENCLAFDPNAGYWWCDLTQVRQLTLTDNVVDFMVGRLRKLPEATQAAVKIAACVGNQFDLATLAVICEQEQEEVASDLWSLLEEGLILPETDTYKFFQGDEVYLGSVDEVTVGYRFLHDRVQQAAYALIPEEQKPATHYQIGQLLLQQVPAEAIDEQVFGLVNQLNHGIGLIDDQDERNRLAQLNLSACRKAKASTAYQAAQDYATIALSLLSSTTWEDDYALSLTLHELAAEVAFLCTDFERMEQFIAAVLRHAKTFLEQVGVYIIKIQALTFQNQLLAAIAMGQSILQKLGAPFPEVSTPEDRQRIIQEVDDLIHSGSIVGEPDAEGNPVIVRTIADIFYLPPLVKPEIMAMIQITSSITPACHILNSPVYPLVISLQTKLSILHGNSPASAFSYASYGVFLLRLGHVKTATQFGRLAYRLVSETKAQTMLPETVVPIGLFLHHRQAPLRETLAMFQLGYQIGLETGKLEQLGYFGYGLCMNAFWCGEPLGTIEFQAQVYRQQLLNLNQTTNANYCRIIWESVIALVGNPAQVPLAFTHLEEEEKLVAEAIAADNWLRLFMFYLHRAMYWFLLGELPRATADIQQTRQYVEQVAGTICKAGCYFYDSLITLANISELANQGLNEQVDAAWQRVHQNQLQLQNWVINAPMNYLHKWQLVEAEKNQILGDRIQALTYYDEAIAGAKANGYLQEEALANELAAKFYLGWGKEKVAAGYMQEAYYSYAHWEAKAKADDLEQRYPQLLLPILQPTIKNFSTLETLTSIASPKGSIHASDGASQLLQPNINTILDFLSILKATQSLASVIQLEELLHQLAQIILQQSGGDRCALILPNHEGVWQVRSIATLEATELRSEPLEGNPHLPVNLIQYVKNTQAVVVINDLKTDLPILDHYLNEQQPKSILCTPILNQGQLVGILYLKNRSTSGVFTDDRLLILNFLCTQAAISLENARLYQQAQDYAQQLEQSQLQVIQSEKMAALGNLVAGVAHEINNPVGFLTGSLNNAKDYVQDLLDHLALYQCHSPQMLDPVQTHAEDIELEYLCEDLPKLLESMQGATDRIKSISTSLRTFSRADSDRKVKADLHEGLDSALLILKYRLKANEHRPEITVIKDYGDLPTIDCFPGQLNQVFMNILANAIDVFDEAAQQTPYAGVTAKSQTITIQTLVLPTQNQVEIRIRDNGQGMTDEVKVKVFDHLFTTKAVGKGTGLGLAIARQIVEEKHDGAITVQSTTGQGTEFMITLPRQSPR